ncbi:MAG: hypothetical protein KF683_10305 [Rubrivivax sp.]|nr:hypothetical protein [Rubrivivax sp.]
MLADPKVRAAYLGE